MAFSDQRTQRQTKISCRHIMITKQKITFSYPPWSHHDKNDNFWGNNDIITQTKKKKKKYKYKYKLKYKYLKDTIMNNLSNIFEIFFERLSPKEMTFFKSSSMISCFVEQEALANDVEKMKDNLHRRNAFFMDISSLTKL